MSNERRATQRWEFNLEAADHIKAIALLPEDANPWSDRNLICTWLAQREEAFRKAVELRPDDRGLWRARGRYLARVGKWKEAASAYSRAIELSSIDIHDHVWVECAAAYLLANDTKGYAAICTKMRKYQDGTQDPDLTYLLARTCALAETSKANALFAARLAEQALEGKLHDINWRAASLHVLGVACYRSGNFKKAVEHLNQSLRTAPAWIGTYMNWPMLALAHHRLGNHKEARDWLDKSRTRFEQGKQNLARAPIGFPRGLDPADWLEFHILHQEAETLLAGKQGESGK